MYIFDFIKGLFKPSKTGLIIWLVLNIAFITAVFWYATGSIYGVFTGIGIYFVSLCIALSPVGEAVLRFQNGCKRIKNIDERQRLYAIFEDAYSRARQISPRLTQGIKLFISNDSAPNAFATGRKTLCVTRGLLEYSDEEVAAVLCHEFGHLAHKDTDAVLMIGVGNLMVSIIFSLFRFCTNIIFALSTAFASLFGVTGKVIALIFFVAGKLFSLILSIIMHIWTRLGVWLVLASGRKNEYEADIYSCRCGYGEQLCAVLASFGTSSKRGIFAALASSHPKTAKRIKCIKDYQRAAV